MKRFAYLAAAAVAAIGVIMFLASLGGHDRAGSCGQNRWPAIVEGSRAIVSDGYYAWHNGRGWHLQFRANPGVGLAGRVSANTRIGLSSCKIIPCRANTVAWQSACLVTLMVQLKILALRFTLHPTMQIRG